MMSRITAMLGMLTAGLFGARDVNRPEPAPVDRSGPVAARAFGPKYAVRARRSYALPDLVPAGFWDVPTRVRPARIGIAALAAAHARRTARNARRVRDALASKRGAAQARARIEIGAWS